MTRRTRRWFLWGAPMAALASLYGLGCGGGHKGIPIPPGNRFQPAVYPGDWLGDWHNTTYATTGSAKITFTNDTPTSTLTIRHELGGSVLGLGTATPETFQGTYTSTGITMTGTSARFGDMTLTIQENGSFVGSGVNLPNPAISRVDFNGVITPSRIDINYTVTFAIGTVARGNASVVKQP